MTGWQETWNAERTTVAAEALRRGGRLRLQVRGESMLPSVWPGDTVEITGCQVEEARPGEIVLALREGRLFLHRFQARHGDTFLLRGDSMPAPDPVFASTAFQGRVVLIVRAGRAMPLPAPLRPWSRALGLLFCHSSIARRLALRLHQRRTSAARPVPGTLASDHQGPR